MTSPLAMLYLPWLCCINPGYVVCSPYDYQRSLRYWLVMLPGCRYENFVFAPDRRFETVSAPHVIHLFSFSKVCTCSE